MKVRCNNCMSIFDEKYIKITDDDYKDEYCPCCEYHGGLMDLEEEELINHELLGALKNIKKTIEANCGWNDTGLFKEDIEQVIAKAEKV